MSKLDGLPKGAQDIIIAQDFMGAFEHRIRIASDVPVTVKDKNGRSRVTAKGGDVLTVKSDGNIILVNGRITSEFKVPCDGGEDINIVVIKGDAHDCNCDNS